MPGIFGFICKQGGDRAANQSLIRRMGEIQLHNPNYELHTHADDWFGLGTVGLPVPGEERLAVVSERNLAAAFSGYIYAFQKLNANMEQPTKKKATRIADIYAAHEASLPEKLNGSFNAVALDTSRKAGIICTDRFGHHQLYYYEDDNIFFFAGEFKAFLEYERFDRCLDDAAIADFFNYQLVLGERTFFKRVKRLRWGHKIQFQNGRITIAPWWQWQFTPDLGRSVEDFVDEGHALYQENVRRQTDGASHVIIPLSGGLDSRMVLAHARLAGLEPHSFSHGQRRGLEAKIAAKVAQTAGVKDHHLIEINPEWTADYAERFIWLTGGMVEIGPCILLGVAERYGLPPTTSAFLNGIAGRTAFAYSYFNKADISATLSREEKLHRLRRSLVGQFVDDNYYKNFAPEHQTRFKAAYYPSIEAELQTYTNVSDLFCYQRDLFVLHNRFKRMFDQVDVNRFVLHDHFALEDDRTLDFYLKVPPELKAYPVRTLLIEALKTKFPELARIPQAHGNVDLFSSPSAMAVKLTAYKKRLAYLAERGSCGLLNFRDLDTYVHYNQWYRTSRKVREFVDGILLDPRTRQRGYYDAAEVQRLLQYEKRGGNSFGVLSLLLSFELFQRLYVDRRQV